MVAHPVRESLVQAAAEEAIQARRKSGSEIKVIDLYVENFDPRMPLEAWRAKADADFVERAHRDHVAALRWATSLVLVYPTWFGGQPAMLKGWLDQVWAIGVAYELPPNRSRIRARLRNIREIVVITSHGSKKHMNMLQGEPGKRLVFRGLRVLCHPLCRVRWVAFYGNDSAGTHDRTSFLARVGRQLQS